MSLADWYRRHLLVRVVHAVCATPGIGRWRALATEGLAGTVLEIGFGTGLNLPFYPEGVERVLAIEPSDEAWALAAERIARASVPVERIGRDAQSIPLPDASVDAVLSTFTLCTVPDEVRAIAEIRRVLRPGGRLHVAEHGLAPGGAVARWQWRLDRLEQRVADGCHLTRDPVALLARHGFEVEVRAQGYETAPTPWSWVTAATGRVAG